MWIELHDGAREHPKILKLARALDIAPVAALGHMTSLWLWALRMAADGNLSSFDSDDIEIAAQWEGERGAFYNATVNLRLIDRASDGHIIHDWEDYSGSLKAAKRMRDLRIRKKIQEMSNDDVTLPNGDVRLRRPTDRPTDRPTLQGEGDRNVTVTAKEEEKPEYLEAKFKATYESKFRRPWNHLGDYLPEFGEVARWVNAKAGIDGADFQATADTLLTGFFESDHAADTDYAVRQLAGRPERFWPDPTRAPAGPARGQGTPPEPPNDHLTAMERIGLENELAAAKSDKIFAEEQNDREGIKAAEKAIEAINAKLKGGRK